MELVLVAFFPQSPDICLSILKIFLHGIIFAGIIHDVQADIMQCAAGVGLRSSFSTVVLETGPKEKLH